MLQISLSLKYGAKITISELQIRLPYIQWMDYLNALMPSDVQVRSDEVVIVREPGYFERLAVVLRTTSNPTIANFFAWR